MGLGGIVGKLIGGLTGNLLGGLFGGEPKQEDRGRAGFPQMATPAKKKPSKAGRLALIKTSQSGVLDAGSTSGRGKLLGN